MKIGRGRAFYWDACIFFHWLKDPVKDQAVIDGIEDIVAMSERGHATIFTSIITRIEVLRGKLTDDAADRFARISYRDVVWINVDPRVAQLAHDIRNHYHKPEAKDMWTPDAIHLATAIIFEADEMNTLDGSSAKKRPHDLLPLNGNVMSGRFKLLIRKPERIPPPLDPTKPLLQLFADAEQELTPPGDKQTATAGDDDGSGIDAPFDDEPEPVPIVTASGPIVADASDAPH